MRLMHGFSGTVSGLLVVLAILVQAEAGEPHHATPAKDKAIGASVEELLPIVRAMNPELAAKALEAEAAAARASVADTLPDPKFQITLDDIAKNRRGLPGRVDTTKYTLQQEFPLWGKLGLKRQIAEADQSLAQGELAALTAELSARLKEVYAEYHQVHLSMEQTGELIDILRVLVQVAQSRYAQGAAGQTEVTAAELERGGLSVELVRLANQRKKLKARLNALLNRPPDSPVVEEPHLRTIPQATALDYHQLLPRVMRANPQLASGQARLKAAEGNRELADREWLPDVGVSVGLVNRREEADGFEATMEMTVPLQWEARRARQREAIAMERAEGSRLEAEQTRLATELQEALLALEEARGVEQVTHTSLLPQARIALQSTLRGYESGATEAVQVLDAVQRLKKYRIEQIKAQFEQQIRLAQIERLLGGEL